MSTPKLKVLVLGAGYAGLMAALRLAHKTDAARVELTLVNNAPFFNERVRNHQLGAGQTLVERPLADFLRGTRIEFVQAQVTALQPAERQVQVEAGGRRTVLRYDYLVYALGSFTQAETTPGVREQAFTLGQDSAQRLAPRLRALAARQGRLLIVGGGNTGVEAATEFAETFSGLRISLVTRRSFAPQLSEAAQVHIRRAFNRLGVHFLEHTDVTALHAGHAATRAGADLPFDVCLWVGGFGVGDLARQGGLRVNGRGQVLIDRAMRSLSHPEVYAVGDAAMPAEAPGAPVRMSLYSAIMMGAHGADCLAAELLGRAPTAFGLSYYALGVSLGRRDGVAQFLHWSRDTPLPLILTGRLAGGFREFFVRFAVWSIRIQRVAPWVFDWPGKRKQRHVPVAPPAAPPRQPAAAKR